MDPRYAAVYGDLVASHWWWRARESMLLREVRRIQAGRTNARILDVGCGDGSFFPLLEEFGTVEGIEPDLATMPGARSGRLIHVVPFEAPLPVHGSFDLILLLDVLEHLDDPVASLTLAGSLLSPGGSILVTVPALRQLWTHHDTLNHHRRRYSRGDLGRHLGSARLHPVRMRYAFHALAIAKLLVRAREKLMTTTPGVPKVPPRFMNQMARLYFQGEALVARPVARWLPGSSLIAVAQLPT